jgi:adenylate cyclase
VRVIGNVVLSGKSEPLRLFHPWNDGLDGAHDASALADYEAAYALLHSDPDGARLAFEALAARMPTDPLVQFHLDRLRRGDTGDVLVFSDK